MNRFFNEDSKKLVMAELLQSYLQPTVEGLFYPATRKICLPEGKMVFGSNDKSSDQDIFFREGLCEALTAKIQKNAVYPKIWAQLHPDVTTWQIVGIPSSQKIKEILLIFVIRDFLIEKQVLEVQLQSLRNSSHRGKSGRLLLLNFSEKSNEFIIKHFKLQNFRSISIPEMESLRRLEGTLVAEVNSHFFITESYFLHLGLSRGGIFWGPQVNRHTNKQFLPLSLHHGLEIEKGR